MCVNEGYYEVFRWREGAGVSVFRWHVAGYTDVHLAY